MDYSTINRPFSLHQRPHIPTGNHENLDELLMVQQGYRKFIDRDGSIRWGKMLLLEETHCRVGTSDHRGYDTAAQPTASPRSRADYTPANVMPTTTGTGLATLIATANHQQLVHRPISNHQQLVHRPISNHQQLVHRPISNHQQLVHRPISNHQQLVHRPISNHQQLVHRPISNHQQLVHRPITLYTEQPTSAGFTYHPERDGHAPSDTGLSTTALFAEQHTTLPRHAEVSPAPILYTVSTGVRLPLLERNNQAQAGNPIALPPGMLRSKSMCRICATQDPIGSKQSNSHAEAMTARETTSCVPIDSAPAPIITRHKSMPENTHQAQLSSKDSSAGSSSSYKSILKRRKTKVCLPKKVKLPTEGNAPTDVFLGDPPLCKYPTNEKDQPQTGDEALSETVNKAVSETMEKVLSGFMQDFRQLTQSMAALARETNTSVGGTPLAVTEPKTLPSPALAERQRTALASDALLR